MPHSDLESRHTPGPWEYSSGGIWAKSPWNARVRIATVTTFSPMNGIDSDANGHVIETAPELLSSLRAIVDFCDDPNGSEKPESLAMGLARLLPAARAALTKATGAAS